MNCDEFSREFDILWNNATSNQAPSLNSYEKSVFLTKAQESLVVDLYKGITGKPFELTEEVASYLSPIIKDISITTFNNVNDMFNKTFSRCNNVTKISSFDDYWFILYESALVSYEDKNCCDNDFNAGVIPTTYDRFIRMQNNPFKKPNDHRIFRLNIGNNSKRDLYLVYPKNGVLKNYQCTYIKHPRPIILENLNTAYEGYDLSINNISTKSECELGCAIHNEILIKAVDLAKTTWVSTIINSKENN